MIEKPNRHSAHRPSPDATEQSESETAPLRVRRHIAPRADLTLRDLIDPIVRDIVASAKSDVVMVSQLNCEAVLGISSRAHLENCRRPDFTPKVLSVGKQRLVDAIEYRAWLRSISNARRDPDTSEVDMDDASAVLAEMGLREHTPRTTKKKSSTPRDSRSSDR